MRLADLEKRLQGTGWVIGEVSSKHEHYFLIIPDFVQSFCDSTAHTFKGSLARHLAAEKLLYEIRDSLDVVVDRIGCKFPLFRYMDGFLSILFGLNCNFPLKNIALYTASYMGFSHLPPAKQVIIDEPVDNT